MKRRQFDVSEQLNALNGSQMNIGELGGNFPIRRIIFKRYVGPKRDGRLD